MSQTTQPWEVEAGARMEPQPGIVGVLIGNGLRSIHPHIVFPASYGEYGAFITILPEEDDTREARARRLALRDRLVSCYNAMIGVSDPEAFVKSRAELLAACKLALAGVYEAELVGPNGEDVHAMLKAAIATEGGAA